MPTPPIPFEKLQEAVYAFEKFGSIKKAAIHLGVPRSTLGGRLKMAKMQDIRKLSNFACISERYSAPKPFIKHVNQKVMHIPDLHCPFMHQDAARFISACIKKYSPTLYVLAGDELDQHAISAHDSDPNGYSPGHELTAGLKQLEEIYALFKEALVCESNHGQRPFKRAYKAGLPSQYLKTYAEFMDAPQGWVWSTDFEIDGVVYSHGESATGANGALQLAIRMGKSQAVGHWHGNAGASYFYNGNRLLFGLYSGSLIDTDSYAFRYGKHFKLKPILGLSIIDCGIPSFVPMITDENNKWVGFL